MMAHAWYHWPMFDEALKKLLGMVEMAVKFKCKALGIGLTFERTEKNGQKTEENTSLSTLIDQLCKKEPTKGLKEWLHDYRQQRNYFAHPKDYNFIGGAAIIKIKNLVNIINLIFLDEAEFKEAKIQSARFEKEYADFKHGLLVLEFNEIRILITEIRLLEVFQIKGDWVYICFFRPVLTGIPENLPMHRYMNPPILALTQHGAKAGAFEAVDFETSSSVKVTKTTHPDNQKAWQEHQQDWNRLDPDSQMHYNIHLRHACDDKVRDFMYRHRWVS